MMLLKWTIRLLETQQQSSQMNHQQIYELVKRMLTKIDGEYFRQLRIKSEQCFNQDDLFVFILTLMERYIVLRQFKKLNTHYQKDISQGKDVFELLALVLYISVNSDIKQEIIESILGFQEDQQRQLMEIIQRIDANCEKVVQFKKIVEKIQNLEQENDVIRSKIVENEESYQNYLQQIQQISTSNLFISKEIIEYDEEKKNVFKELQINKIQEFAQICFLNKKQNVQLSQSLQNLQGDRLILSEQNIGLKKQLKCYGETIQKQIKQIQDLKNKCKTINQQYWLNDFGVNDFLLQIPTLPLRDSKNKINIQGNSQHQKQKMPTDRTQCSNRQQILEDSFQIKNNLHVLISLEELQLQEKEKYKQIEKLKEMHKIEIYNQRKLDKKIRKLQECHRSYIKQFSSLKLIKK